MSFVPLNPEVLWAALPGPRSERGVILHGLIQGQGRWASREKRPPACQEVAIRWWVHEPTPYSLGNRNRALGSSLMFAREKHFPKQRV